MIFEPNIPPTSAQLGLAFGLDDAPPAPNGSVRSARSRRPAPSPSPKSFAEMAQALDAHPDYRVIRRLVPRLDFGPAPAGAEPFQLLVLDTETTGLNSASDVIIELALLRVAVDGRTGLPFGPVQVYDGLQDPGRPLPSEIVQVTGITDAMLAGQSLDDARVADLVRGVDLVVAHNAGFDRPFVEARYPVFAGCHWACSWADADWKAWGHGSAKLESLLLDLGWFYDAHRAETDCHALLALLVHRPALEGGGTVLSTLWAAAHQPRYRLQATGAPFEAKDVLKARGYRWDANQRVWVTVLGEEAALHAELGWLKDAVYGGRAVRVQVETLHAPQRFSTRTGPIQMMAVGAMPLNPP